MLQLRSYLSTAALGLLIVYFAYHAFTGEQGLLTSEQRDQTLAVKRAELERLTAERREAAARQFAFRRSSRGARPVPPRL